jgi:predicted RNase H-like HicB family nuclease
MNAERVCENGITNYTVVIHEEPDGGFWAEVLALPSQGETIEELRENVREAISGVIEVARERTPADAVT